MKVAVLVAIFVASFIISVYEAAPMSRDLARLESRDKRGGVAPKLQGAGFRHSVSYNPYMRRARAEEPLDRRESPTDKKSRHRRDISDVGRSTPNDVSPWDDPWGYSDVGLEPEDPWYTINWPKVTKRSQTKDEQKPKRRLANKKQRRLVDRDYLATVIGMGSSNNNRPSHTWETHSQYWNDDSSEEEEDIFGPGYWGYWDDDGDYIYFDDLPDVDYYPYDYKRSVGDDTKSLPKHVQDTDRLKKGTRLDTTDKKSQKQHRLEDRDYLGTIIGMGTVNDGDPSDIWGDPWGEDFPYGNDDSSEEDIYDTGYWGYWNDYGDYIYFDDLSDEDYYPYYYKRSVGDDTKSLLKHDTNKLKKGTRVDTNDKKSQKKQTLLDKKRSLKQQVDETKQKARTLNNDKKQHRLEDRDYLGTVIGMGVYPSDPFGDPFGDPWGSDGPSWMDDSSEEDDTGYWGYWDEYGNYIYYDDLSDEDDYYKRSAGEDTKSLPKHVQDTDRLKKGTRLDTTDKKSQTYKALSKRVHPAFKHKHHPGSAFHPDQMA